MQCRFHRYQWRVVREVEGAALEMRFASNRRNVGSNPMLSVIYVNFKSTGLRLCFCRSYSILLPKVKSVDQAFYHKYYFDSKVMEHDIVFDYKIREGIGGKSNAIALLELLGYPREIVQKARKYAI